MEDKLNRAQAIKSQDELEKRLKEISSGEQLYSIALFDILGFSNFVESNGTQVILDLYNKLLDLINKQKSSFSKNGSFAGDVVPAPVSADWKSSIMIAGSSGYINVCHFSDTFIIFVNYQLRKKPFMLAAPKVEEYPLLLGEIGTPYHLEFYNLHHIYLSFLQTCMDFFCQAIVSGIPLRGCISTGTAVMDQYKSIYLGSPLVEAARGEPARNSLGISFGKSFNNYHPVYNDYFIPYFEDVKQEKSKYLSPMMLDWARYWRETPEFNDYDLHTCINLMNNNIKFLNYYENTIKFFDFSLKHKNWPQELDRTEIKDIIDYYHRTEDWFKSIK